MLVYQLNMTLMAPVLPAAAAVSKPVTTSFSEKPKRCVIRGSQSILPSSNKSRQMGYCSQHSQSAQHTQMVRWPYDNQTAVSCQQVSLLALLAVGNKQHMHLHTTKVTAGKIVLTVLTVLVYLKLPKKSISLKTVCMVGMQHFSAPRPTSTILPPGATASSAVCSLNTGHIVSRPKRDSRHLK